MHIILCLFVIFVSTPIMVIWSGYVLTVLWSWFVVSTFGVPELLIPQAIGLCLVVRLATLQMPPEDKREATERMMVGSIFSALCPALFLLMGWIVKAFLP